MQKSILIAILIFGICGCSKQQTATQTPDNNFNVTLSIFYNTLHPTCGYTYSYNIASVHYSGHGTGNKVFKGICHIGDSAAISTISDSANIGIGNEMNVSPIVGGDPGSITWCDCKHGHAWKF